ncbi:coiled-coil domain-containing protein 191-like [Lineus longissimus]|uniref:coiled-coil domain-containing protein 191-like n=1 Tax=Lineus longissimus TaxID=88925 RepID=UPI002B4CA69D
MSFHKPDLYRWKRREEPRVYSRSQRVATDNDIQDWIKTVEDASSKAAAEAFGLPYQVTRTQGKAKAKAAIQHVREHDAAYAEAQDLLNQWVTEKVNLDDGDGYDDMDDGWCNKPSKAEIKREWDNMVVLGDYQDENPDVPSAYKHRTPSVDPYYDLENENENEIVGNILNNLMEKDVVHEGFKGDLGLEKRPEVDPRTKMKLRHQQVKENRERRERELEKKNREQRTRKETQFQAKQIVMKEEKERAMKEKREDLLLQQEMARVRKEMFEQRRMEEEKKARDRKEKEALAQSALEELERQRWEEEQQEMESRHKVEMEYRRRQAEIENLQKEFSSKNFKLLQKYFSAWYDVVLERRLQMGKARAMADWRCLLRAWNGWKMYARGRRLDREAREHEEDMKLYHRKRQMADAHHRLTLLRRCFMAWQLFLTLNEAEQELHKGQNATKNKMAAFLEKAATGKLWSDRPSPKSESPKSNARVDRVDSARKKVDEIFAANETRPRHRLGNESTRSEVTTSRSETSTITNNSSRHHGVKVPTEPWQVTRKHLKLTNEQIAALGQGQEQEVVGQGNPQRERRLRQEIRAWEKPAPPTSNFEHRHKEQQSMLKVQQKQIQEQQKLIEDLQYMQQQQLLQQQLVKQQDISQQLNNSVNLQNLQTAQVQLENLQRNAVGLTKQTNVKNKQTSGKSQVSGQGDGPDTARTELTSVSTGASTMASKTSNRHRDFQRKMEERAAERQRIKEERETKKRQLDQEKYAKMKADEEERLKREEEEKKARVEARREQKRMERQREVEKQRQMERTQELLNLAEDHYRKSHLRRKGFSPWRKLIAIARENEEKAMEYHSHSVLRRSLLSWRDVIRQEVEEKEVMADMLYKFTVVRRSFKNWRRHGKYLAIHEEKARRFYEKNVKWKIIRAWADYSIEAKMRMWELERLSREHNIHRMKKTHFLAWRRYPKVLQEERLREKRKADMRKKVASILPDFSGLDQSRTSFD